VWAFDTAEKKKLKRCCRYQHNNFAMTQSAYDGRKDNIQFLLAMGRQLFA
jgi:hypothetical protein